MQYISTKQLVGASQLANKTITGEGSLALPDRFFSFTSRLQVKEKKQSGNARLGEGAGAKNMRLVTTMPDGISYRDISSM